ncbi:PACE efflux transporter [Antarctobacter heliothermus]|uniref:Uncharacterized membrane protein n=1 Tax=Antarctobacter heliothermus TaxID=74033 RepID=A0A239GPQ7_9RHOB|nr:PACE efflux transporter [Antarctobacter heliothermus]SNS70961.1 Uncharacterized membrane protein [Antarctobacter heliothermus]
MRTPQDRIRHAISFEIVGILLIVPPGAVGFGMHAKDIGVVAIIGSVLATLWNYLYTLMFDHALKRLKGRVQKTGAERVLHALLFEAGLLVVTLPLFALFLGISLWQALIMDIAFVVFFLVYAFVFNWVYDLLYPVSE